MLSNDTISPVDISGMIDSFEIKESVFERGLTLTFTLSDSINMFEDYRISGLENVQIKLVKKGLGERKAKSIILDFITEEIPAYSVSAGTALYSFRCIPKFIHDSQFIRLSRVHKGTITDIIVSILRDDLGFSNVEVRTPSAGILHYISPNIKPLNAINKLLEHAWDENNSPIMMWQNLDGTVIIDSLFNMKASDNYDKYRRLAPGYNAPAKETGLLEYNRLRTTILNIVSNLKANRYFMGSHGAYGSSQEILDISKKKYTALNRDHYVGSLDLKEKYGSRKYVDILASETLNESLLTPITNSIDRLPSMNSDRHRLDTISHFLTLNGDLESLAGRNIEIEIPKTINFGESKNKDIVDKSMSGKYLVTSVIHKFSSNHQMSVKIQRDNINE